MKYSIQALLLATTLLVGTASADEGTRSATLEYWKNQGNNLTQSAQTVMSSDDGLIRLRAKAVDGAGSVFIYQQVGTGDGRRRTQERLSETVVPWPVDGSDVEKNDNAINFKENTAIVDVNCFNFRHTDPELSFQICKDKYDITVVDGVAQVKMAGFDLGEYTWYVSDADGNQSTPQSFTIVEPKSDSTIVRRSGNLQADVGEAEWTFDGQVQGASGRLYYSSYGVDYACSATAIKDNKSGRSLLLTAAHCVWDDIDRVWGSNVVFIPNRDATQSDLSGADIHRQCTEDVCGCWTASAGIVHDKWMSTEWPANLEWDWGLWVVDDVGSHNGVSCGSDALDEAVEEMEFEIGVDLENMYVGALGYSLEHNPDFRYCADTVEYLQPTTGTDTFWLDGCGLSGGASGGPWVMDLNTGDGTGKIVSVNSWSFSDSSGMGGPIIDASGARCLVNAAREVDFDAVNALGEGEQGVFVNCFERPCIPVDEASARKLRGQNDKRVLCEQDK